MLVDQGISLSAFLIKGTSRGSTVPICSVVYRTVRPLSDLLLAGGSLSFSCSFARFLNLGLFQAFFASLASFFTLVITSGSGVGVGVGGGVGFISVRC